MMRSLHLAAVVGVLDGFDRAVRAWVACTATGGDSVLHVADGHTRVPGVVHISQLPKPQRPDTVNDVLIYHALGADGEITDEVLWRPEPLVVIDHGHATSDPHLSWDPPLAGRLAANDVHLGRLAPRAALAIVPNAERADRLHALGYQRVAIVAPLTAPSTILAASSTQGTLNHFDTVMTGPVVLCPASMAAHEHIEQLIKAYHCLATYILPTTHLLVTGGGPTSRESRYVLQLERQINELNLIRTWLSIDPAPTDLKAYVSRAALCVVPPGGGAWPEAVQCAVLSGVPMLAVDADGLRLCGGETSADVQYLPIDDEPFVLAEAMAARLRSVLVGASLESMSNPQSSVADEVRWPLREPQTIDVAALAFNEEVRRAEALAIIGSTIRPAVGSVLS